jgi:hypothetical protein
VLAGAAGTHSVCVCVIHQNADLMLEAIKIPRNQALELISMIVCDRENRDCMLREYKECPSPNSDLRKYLEDHLANFESDQVAFSMWMSTARTMMMPTMRQKVGGSVKRSATRARLQRPYGKQLLTAEDFFKFARSEAQNSVLSSLKKTDISEVRNHLKTRYANAKTIPGSRGFHHFIAENESMISTRIISSDNESFSFTVHFKSNFF